MNCAGKTSALEKVANGRCRCVSQKLEQHLLQSAHRLRNAATDARDSNGASHGNTDRRRRHRSLRDDMRAAEKLQRRKKRKRRRRRSLGEFEASTVQSQSIPAEESDNKCRRKKMLGFHSELQSQDNKWFRACWPQLPRSDKR